jgi:caa(3)-type oxidase subunit IV
METSHYSGNTLVVGPTEVRAHPHYGRIFLLLAVFTVLEVAASYLPAPYKFPILVVLAATKALMVLLYFMHLKFDSRYYSYAMILAAILIIPIILVIVVVMPKL